MAEAPDVRKVLDQFPFFLGFGRRSDAGIVLTAAYGAWAAPFVKRLEAAPEGLSLQAAFPEWHVAIERFVTSMLDEGRAAWQALRIGDDLWDVYVLPIGREAFWALVLRISGRRREGGRFPVEVLDLFGVPALLHQDGRIRYANEAARRLLGRRGMSWTDLSPLKLFAPESRPEFLDSLIHGRPEPLVLRVLDADGAERTAEVRTVRLPEESGMAYLTVIGGPESAVFPSGEPLRYDPKSGFFSRLGFYQRFGEALDQARRRDRRLALALLNVDRFKFINETLGHAYGDRLIAEVAERLRGAIDPERIGWVGADEFAFWIDGADRAEFQAALRRVLAVFERPFRLSEYDWRVTARIGAAVFPDDGRTADVLWQNAAIAQNEATSGEAVRFFAPEMASRRLRRLLLETELRGAIDSEQFVLYFQPLYNVVSGRMIAVEALLRWQHPTLGLIPPGEFIPVAEETGLIVPLGRRVLWEAAAEMEGWRRSGAFSGEVHVNISLRQFEQPDFVDQVRAVLEETGLPPSHLVLELTETAIMQNVEENVARLRMLKGMGVKLAIDDFGTGYSSLSYLHRLPVDTVKIDRSFVSAVHAAGDDAVIATAIIHLAHALGLNVVAEGVETAAQVEFLSSNACYDMQGFYFGRPMPKEELMKAMK
ncbi:EAL domain-containing protein [Hydrogenibacillus schlegelii]|nr:EAL domain-containing protein [Hydrogenibacillus schlegelii]MBT9281526.1 EAL domain-containing protein [Hydrogenibacillus schlegelii]